MNDCYTARLCWNENDWQFPDGAARESETYHASEGFGHEEWLFCTSWVVDGYHYAFLEPVRKSYRHQAGRTIDVLLYSIDPHKKRYYVGRIDSCEVISEQQAEAAIREYRSREWDSVMRDQVKRVSGGMSLFADDSPGLDFFNIRFRIPSAHLFELPRLAPPGDELYTRRFNRYTLAPADAGLREKWNAVDRTPVSKEESRLLRIRRKAIGEVDVDQPHRRLQDSLLPLLRSRFPGVPCKAEVNYVDIVVEGQASRLLLEIKSGANARRAIREALGQILEYRYFALPDAKKTKLVIIAPCSDPQADAYLARLRETFKLPIYFCCFSEGDQLPVSFPALD